MSDRRRWADAALAPGDGQVTVMGSARRRERVCASGHGEPRGDSSLASRREAALRVLVEAYRRDAGPGALDPV